MFRGRIIFATPMLWFMGFLVTFTIGGMTGVLMSVPGADFQLHNSLFLVAHFHNMIIGGVLFGFFAGFTYWFPKVMGFKLNERLGVYAFWCWVVGFVMAFIPLYALGLMGMTRRLSQIDAAAGWHPLLVVAAIGVCVLAVGMAFQVAQLLVSIWQRKANRAGNDPWNGRTLEWSTSSPPPEYNFATIPIVHGRDAFWHIKQEGTVTSLPHKHDIEVPKNTSVGLTVAAFALCFGFGMIWHMWWLAVLGLVGIAILIIVRSFAYDGN
jgi:cytochrome o ubiquinol oxidase subunit 1